MAGELRFATYVTERSAHAIEFVVADRDGDNVPERIRYAWSGTAGDPLSRTNDDGTPSPLLDAVQQFQFTYTVDTDTDTIATTSEAGRGLLANDVDVPRKTKKTHVTSAEWFAPDDRSRRFRCRPAGRHCLVGNPHRAEFSAKTKRGQTRLRAFMRSAGEPNDGPTGEVPDQVYDSHGTDLVDNPVWTSRRTSVGSIPELSLHRIYSLAWTGRGGRRRDQLCTTTIARAAYWRRSTPAPPGKRCRPAVPSSGCTVRTRRPDPM